MALERTGQGLPAEPQPPSAGPQPSEGVSPALRLQILSTEHWSLLATRSLAWSEVFARASTYLSALAGAIVALALVGQGSGFGTNFLVFGVVILPVVLVIGVTTHVRMGESNAYEAQCIVGMNRIRHGYLELAPDLEPYFVMSAHDDARGIALTEGIQPGGPQLLHLFASIPVVILVINSVVAAAFMSFVGQLAGAAGQGVLGIGLVTFGAALAAHVSYGRRNIARVRAWEPRFPEDSAPIR
jgi:hypothetical protein